MLSPYRVLDLTEGPAALASFILAGLGADVIKVEPPGGSRSRLAAPLADGEPDELASLSFHAWNRGKRSAALDLANDADRADFDALVATADFVISDLSAARADELGVSFDALRSIRPDLVHVAISPFGQDGPFADHAATDLTLAAMGGAMALIGDRDRRPVRVTVPQTWLHAAAEAALGGLVAHEIRLATGEAQFVDMSVQAAVFWTGLNAMITHAITGRDNERCGTELSLATIQAQMVFATSDGEVCMLPSSATLLKLLPWMLDSGAVTQDWIDAEDWETYERRRLDGEDLVWSFDDILEAVRVFAARLSKAELFAGGLERGLTIVPVATAGDVIALDHLDVRDYWDWVELPSGHRLKAAGPFVKSSTEPISWKPAPRIGEHTDELRAELRRAGSTAAVSNAPALIRPERALPLDGIKVADFSWIGVGPITAKALADHGATVVRIESDDPPDRLRLTGPFTNDEFGINRCQFYGSFNTSKQSLHLNLKDPVGHDIALQMLEWCDVALDSFTAGTLTRLGLGYDVARERNPAIVMVETCLFGQTGPLRSLAGYGYHAAAISGFYEVTGWPDRAPGGPWNAYTDTIAPRFLATTVLAALDHRRRTGQGQYIDQAQMEASLHFLGPELLNAQLTGESPRRNGNVAPGCVPHDVYPCVGEDRWCAIAVETDEQWASLVTAIGSPDWALDPALATAAGRCDKADAIDAALGEFTSGHDAYEVMSMLQSAGVPAGVVQRSSDLLDDPQLAHRRFFRPMHHPEMGDVPYEGHQYRIAGYDNGPRFPAPCLGEHTFEVLTEHLGMDMEQAAAALASGACG